MFNSSLQTIERQIILHVYIAFVGFIRRVYRWYWEGAEELDVWYMYVAVLESSVTGQQNSFSVF